MDNSPTTALNSELQTDAFTPRRKIHWPSIIQFGLSILAIAFLWSGSAIFAMMGLVGLVARDPSIAQPAPGFMLATGMALIGFLAAPSAFYALWRALDKPLEQLPRRLRHFGFSSWPLLAALVTPLVIVAGYAAIRFTRLDWLFVPPLHILAIGLPIAVLLYFTVRNLPLGSLQRMWGVFGSGLILAPVLILGLEALALIAFVLLVIISITSQPQLVEQLSSLSQWLMTNEPSQEATLQALAPYLFRPSVILSVLTFGAILVPLIEELIKPIGVWLLVGRNLYPSAGFAAGAISGAGYALFESLVLTSGTQEWASLVVARIGTSVIHIVTAAMTGWALVLAWQRRRYLILAGTYLLAVTMHGLWNAITLFFSFASLGELQGVVVKLPPVFKLADAAPYALLALAILGLLIMFVGNRRFTQTYRTIRAEKAGRSQDSPPDDVPPDRVAGESML